MVSADTQYLMALIGGTKTLSEIPNFSIRDTIRVYSF